MASEILSTSYSEWWFGIRVLEPHGHARTNTVGDECYLYWGHVCSYLPLGRWCSLQPEEWKNCGCSLWELVGWKKNSKDTVFPLFTYRSETRLHLAFDEICGITVHERACHQPHQNPQSICPTQELSLGFETLQAFMAPASWRPWWSGSMLAGGIWKLACEVVESLNRLSAGVAVDNRILRCLTTDFLGDWKWHRETLLQVSMLFSACMLWRSNAPWCTTTVPENCHVTFKEWFAMSAHWKANNICHACVMTKRDFAQVPNPLKNVMRRDLNDFISRATKPGDKST